MRRLWRQSCVGAHAAWWLCSMATVLFATIVAAVAPDERAVETAVAVVEREVYLMGTRARLVTYDGDRTKGLARLEAFVAILEESEQELSTWREGSALSAINRQPVGKRASLAPSLCRVFDEIKYWQQETGGTFDPAVGPLVEAYGLRAEGRIPSPEELAAARSRTGMRHFRFSINDCTVVRTRTAILDEGAFGKGEALDRVRAAVPEAEAAPWLIDLGGQVLVSGRPPDQDVWAVAIADPTRRDRALFEVRLLSGSLSTSGGSERDLTVDGHRIAHHLDPRSGMPAAFQGSVVVWHERALVADILSTALYVMGPRKGLAWADDHDIAACFLIPKGRNSAAAPDIRASRAFMRRFGTPSPTS